MKLTFFVHYLVLAGWLVISSSRRDVMCRQKDINVDRNLNYFRINADA